MSKYMLKDFLSERAMLRLSMLRRTKPIIVKSDDPGDVSAALVAALKLNGYCACEEGNAQQIYITSKGNASLDYYGEWI